MPCRQGIAGPNTANRTEVLRPAHLTRSLVAWLSPPLHRRRFPQALRYLTSSPTPTPTRCSSPPSRAGSSARFDRQGSGETSAETSASRRWWLSYTRPWNLPHRSTNPTSGRGAHASQHAVLLPSSCRPLAACEQLLNLVHSTLTIGGRCAII